MNLLSVLRLRHAVKQYASRLGAYLQHAYGASECYSAGQIRAGVSRLRLNPRYIVLGYAEFLSEDVFASLATEMPIPMGYWEARKAFERLKPPSMLSASGNPETTIPIVGVGYSDH
jgi:hypothetical protein